MEQLFRLRDTVAGAFTPARRRSIATRPETPHQPRPFNMSNSEPPKLDNSAVLKRPIFKSKPFTTASYTSPPGTNETHEVQSLDTESDGDEEEHIRSPTNANGKRTLPAPSPSGRKKAKVTSNDGTYQDEEEKLDKDDKDEFQVPVVTKVTQYLDRQTEVARRKQTENHLQGSSWHPDEADLYRAISNRGLEPLLPQNWQLDFGNCPPQLFTPDPKNTIINSKLGTDFAATTALNNLTTVGSKVRPLLERHIPPEPFIARELQRYLKWAAKDGGFYQRRYLPLLMTFVGEPNQAVSAINQTVQDELHHLALLHRQDLALSPPGRVNEDGTVQMFRRPPPVVYGIIIIRYHLVIVTLDAGDPNAKLRLIAPVSFAEPDMDVWNGFAIAILVCWVRDKLMERKEEMKDSDEES